MKFNSIEHELLVLLTHPGIGIEKRHRLERLSSENINWQYLFMLADFHGVFPPIYKYLSSNPISSIPEAELTQLEASYRTNALRNMSLTGELISILRSLKRADIAAFPLKGPVLAQLLYGDIALRSFSDLDILVPKEQFSQAEQALMNMGYRYAGTQTGDAKQKVARGKHHYNFVKDNRFYVELHSTLEPLNYSNGEVAIPFWKSVRSVSCFDIQISMPSNEELLLFLCRHGSRHLWERLKWLNDVAQILHNEYELDWSYVITRAQRSHTKRLLFLGLYLTRELFDSTFPGPVLREIQEDSLIPELGSRTLGMMFDELGEKSSHMRYWKKERLRVQLREGCFQRLRYISSMLWSYFKRLFSNLSPNERDRAFVPLPSYLSFIYYFLRPLRLLMDYWHSR